MANEGRQELGRGGKEVEDRAGWMEEGGERLEKREVFLFFCFLIRRGWTISKNVQTDS